MFVRQFQEKTLQQPLSIPTVTVKVVGLVNMMTIYLFLRALFWYPPIIGISHRACKMLAGLLLESDPFRIIKMSNANVREIYII